MDANNDENSAEKLQKKLYFIQEKLQSMTQTLSPKYQSRISLELICNLANYLMNDTIFSIIKSLVDIQHEIEKQLYQKRERLKFRCQTELEELLAEPDLTETDQNAIIAQKKIEHDDQLDNFNRYIIQELDKKVTEQQKVLEEAGVPGFHQTKDPKEIRIQMHLLEFILKIRKLDMP